MTTLLKLLLCHGVSLMPPGCGVVASAMLFYVFGVLLINFDFSGAETFVFPNVAH